MDNTANAVGAGQIPAGSTLKVFISYAREDHAIAEELVAGLELCGFSSYLDREDIAPGEPWEERLGKLIRESDTVVCVISPDWIESRHCAWEVSETERLSKRLIPVIWRSVSDDRVPKQLQRLNYIVFDERRSFSKSLGDLVRALRLDLDWVREHTRLGELALRWQERNRPIGLLLRGEEIQEATLWLAKRPKDAPEITIQQRAFIDASIRAAEEEYGRRVKLQSRARKATIAAAVVFAAGAVVSTIAWFRAEEARQALKERVEELRAANQRLSRKIALRVAPTGKAPYSAGQNWYQVATDYAGAIAIVAAKEAVRPRGSGFFVRGSALYGPWGDDAVFVTASFVIGEKESQGLRLNQARAYFPGSEGNEHAIEFAQILWERPFETGGQLGVSVLRSKGSLPFAARPIEKVRSKSFDGLREVGALPQDDREGTPGRALATVGYGAVSSGFALFLHNLLGWSGRDAEGRPLRLRYSNVSEGGVAGAPVFDVETGELVAIHQTGIRSGGQDVNFFVGEGAALDTVIATIKADLGPPK